MNIPAGEKVPESGRYGCTNCVVASALTSLFTAMSGASGASSQKSGGRTIHYFEKGVVFPQCPHCGHLTGWSVTEESADLPSGAVEASSLQGLLSKSMQGSQCDVCGETVDLSSIKIVGPALLVKATESGYTPSRLPATWKSQCELLGVSVASHWATVVKQNSSVDWKLCKRCSEEVGSFKSEANAKAPNE